MFVVKEWLSQDLIADRYNLTTPTNLNLIADRYNFTTPTQLNLIKKNWTFVFWAEACCCWYLSTRHSLVTVVTGVGMRLKCFWFI